MTRINRAAWQRIKARLAKPDPNADRATNIAAAIRTTDGQKAELQRSITIYKARSCGPTMSLLDIGLAHLREILARDNAALRRA